MIVGIILGLLNMVGYSFIYLGELLMILFLTGNLLMKKKKISINGIFIPIMALILIILLILMNFYFDIISYKNIVKNVLKYVILIIELILIYANFELNYKKTMKCLTPYLMVSFFTINLQDRIGLNLEIIGHIFPICLIEILYLLKNKDSDNRIFTITLGALFFSIIFRSRTNILISISFLIINLVYRLKPKKGTQINKIIKKTLTLLLLCFIALIAKKYFIDSLFLSTASNNERNLLIKIALEEFKSNVIHGTGFGNYNIYARRVLNYVNLNPSLGPHNLYLEFLSESGIIGTSLLMITYIYLYKRVRKSKDLILYLTLDYLLTFFMFNVFSGYNRFICIFLIAAIAFFSNCQKSEKKANCFQRQKREE